MTSSVLWRDILCSVAAVHAAFGMAVLAGSFDVAHGTEPMTA